jgi:hypothetical protein
MPTLLFPDGLLLPDGLLFPDGLLLPDGLLFPDGLPLNSIISDSFVSMESRESNIVDWTDPMRKPVADTRGNRSNHCR